MNKRAILLPKTLNIIIAVICIVILIGLAVKVYGSVKRDNEIKQAQKSLENLANAIENVIQDNQPREFFVESPYTGDVANWYIFAWPSKDFSKPSVCNGENCICVCLAHPVEGGVVEECNKGGACQVTTLPVKTFYFFVASHSEGGIAIQKTDDNNLLALDISKENNIIIIKEKK